MITSGMFSQIRVLHMVLILFASVMLSSCGGGGGGGNTTTPTPSQVTNADPTGYYDITGTASVDDGSGGTLAINQLEAMINNNKLLMMSATSSLLYDISIITIEGNNFSGSANVYYLSGSSLLTTTASVDGTITQGSSITGTLKGTGVGNGTFSLVYNNQSATLPLTSTVWQAVIGGSGAGYVIGFSTDNNGVMSNGKAAASGYLQGCTLTSGNMKTVNNTNIFMVTATIEKCGDAGFNGDYTGMAAFQDSSSTAIDLAISKSDGKHVISGDFYQ
jgi:hypothetical protein